jgi:hypothetical protein
MGKIDYHYVANKAYKTFYDASGSTDWQQDVESYPSGYRIVIYHRSYLNFLSAAVLDAFTKLGTEICKDYDNAAYYVECKEVGGKFRPCMIIDVFK